jgi:hypothetical protein
MEDPEMKYRDWRGLSLISEEWFWHSSRIANQENCIFIDIVLSLVLCFNCSMSGLVNIKILIELTFVLQTDIFAIILLQCGIFI